MSTQSPLDTARVDELADLFGDKEILLQLYDEFLEECPARLQTMRDGLEQQKAYLIDSGAHAIKGSSANLGAVGIQETAKLVEDLARTNDLDEVGEFLDRLEGEIERLNGHLKAHGLG
ncbi:MAG: Hpt domain-containing protein [Planctomycetes bacterium]|nr:Hpt domain-containing protein [Planctomycetota bacterium]MCP4770093.1 Hpt domain-containing protein [Planctomycetota bacterium]